MRLFTVLLFSVLGVLCFAQQKLQGTIWLGTSLMYETPWEAGRNYTFGFGIAPVVIDRPGRDNTARLGLAAEGVFYQDRQPRGLAFVGRIGIVDGGFFGAPGLYYVSRPRDPRMIDFRVGALAPLGNLSDGDIVPWIVELGVGFHF